MLVSLRKQSFYLTVVFTKTFVLNIQFDELSSKCFFLFYSLSVSQTFYKCLLFVCQCLQVYEGTSHHQLCLSFICLSVCLFFCLPGFAGFHAHFYASDAASTLCLSVCKVLAPKGFCTLYPPPK